MSSDSPEASSGISRRQFTRVLAGGTAAALAPFSVGPAGAVERRFPRRVQGLERDERYWQGIRDEFVMPRDLACLNAANLCPCSRGVLESLTELTRGVDRDPSQQNRAKLAEGKEQTRQTVAEFLRVSPEEIVLTRNTSEANNIVSSGLGLSTGDEVVIFSDNHPSNHRAWTEKAARHGFTVTVVEQVNPHPGGEAYVDAFVRASTARTRLWAFTHVTNTVGDLLPVEALCAAARQRDILTLVDGAQAFGVLDLDLATMKPDFYSGSGHKWPCGPRETGVLFASRQAQDRLAPSVISLYAGAVGASRTLEAYGQRDEPAIIAFGDALRFQMSIGKPAIERRSRELTGALIAGLRNIDGVALWTDPAADRSTTVVSFRPGTLDARRLSATLYENERIACATRAGADRPGLRLSPHFYNLHAEIDRAVAAIATYMRTGV
jgi:isopenicillin-N epimerase